jgi:hypothetical protein
MHLFLSGIKSCAFSHVSFLHNHIDIYTNSSAVTWTSTVDCAQLLKHRLGTHGGREEREPYVLFHMTYIIAYKQLHSKKTLRQHALHKAPTQPQSCQRWIACMQLFYGICIYSHSVARCTACLSSSTSLLSFDTFKSASASCVGAHPA